jgi:cytochrome c peroxidase
MKVLRTLLMLTPLLFAWACDEPDDPDIFNPTPYTLNIPKGFPTILNIPADNPMTVEGVELGRLLFYDGRLSGRTHPDSLMSCATCHLQSRAFECGVDHPKFTGGFPFGITGIKTPHVMLPMINLVFNNNGYLWNGMIRSGNPAESRRRLEDLTWMGIHAPHEMAGDTNRTKTLLQSIDMYPPLFKKAFGTEEITGELIAKAISQFVRTLISSDSKAHKVFRKEANFSLPELRGYILFTTEAGADCFHCHGSEGSPLFTGNLFYNNAKDSLFTGAYADPRDRYAVTGNQMDLGAYKATTLINIALTGPYMHDGRFETLEEVIDFYSDGLVWSPYADPLMHKLQPPFSNGANLTPAQKADLLAFLHSLTDSTFINNPAFSNPRPTDPFFQH